MSSPHESPIHAVIERWHAHMRGELANGLDVLLHDDVVFYSPIVYTPQRGKAINTPSFVSLAILSTKRWY